MFRTRKLELQELIILLQIFSLESCTKVFSLVLYMFVEFSIKLYMEHPANALRAQASCLQIQFFHTISRTISIGLQYNGFSGFDLYGLRC